MFLTNFFRRNWISLIIMSIVVIFVYNTYSRNITHELSMDVNNRHLTYYFTIKKDRITLVKISDPTLGTIYSNSTPPMVSPVAFRELEDLLEVLGTFNTSAGFYFLGYKRGRK